MYTTHRGSDAMAMRRTGDTVTQKPVVRATIHTGTKYEPKNTEEGARNVDAKKGK